MAQWIIPAWWLTTALVWWGVEAGAAPPCIRLAGMVQDYKSHRPLAARLYLKTPTGRADLGSSTATTGRFEVGIACPALTLIVERAGYRPQALQLNVPTLPITQQPVEVIIPLVAVDSVGKDRPYLQSEQTYFEQTGTANTANQPQHNLFIINDALSGQVLAARTCFFFTKNGQKLCRDADAAGRLSFDFAQKDIVAMEVTAAGYQTYQGNLIIDELDGRQRRHTIRLTRELTILSVTLDPSAGGCELRAAGTGKAIGLAATGPGNVWVVGDVWPQQYTLVVLDHKHVPREQNLITVRPGLNVIRAVAHAPAVSNAPAAFDSTALPTLPDPPPMLYFEQGSYGITPAARAVLLQTAAYLLQHPDLRVRLLGHTDREGDEPLNLALSENRAKVVSTFLFGQGVPDGRMDIVGYGSRYPVASSDSEENKAKNRRVQLKFITN